MAGVPPFGGRMPCSFNDCLDRLSNHNLPNMSTAPSHATADNSLPANQQLQGSFSAYLPQVFGNFIDHLKGPVAIKDREGRFVYVNDALARLLGEPKSAIVGKTDYDFVSKEEADEYRRNDLESLANSDSYSIEYFTDEDGRQQIYRSHKFGIANEQGEWIGNAVIAEEVTELQQAQLTIAEQKARIEGILNSSSESIWSLNTKFEVEFVNDIVQRDFLQAFGVWLEPGSNMLEALPPVIRPYWQEKYERVFAGETLDFQERVESDQGCYYLRLRFYPIRVGDTIVSMAAFSKNVTSEVQALKERNQYHERMLQQIGALRSIAHNYTHGMMPHLSQMTTALGQLRQAKDRLDLPQLEAVLAEMQAATDAISTLVQHNMERVKMVEAEEQKDK